MRYFPQAHGTGWVQVPDAGDKALDVLRQILRSYRPDPVHSVSQVVDDSLQEAVTTTKAPSVEKVDVDDSPEDVLKIIEDVAEKLAGKKLPDSVAAGGVVSNKSQAPEEEEDEETEPNPKLEMQEQINHTQAIEDDDIRIRDDDPGDDTECRRGKQRHNRRESSSEGTEDAKQTAQVDGDTHDSSVEDDEATTTEVLESDLVNVSSEADEEPKKMGSGETSSSEDGGAVHSAAETMKAEADQSEDTEDSKPSHDESGPMAVHSNHGGGERFAVHSSHKGAPSSPTVVKKGASGRDDEDPEEEEAANPGKSGGKVLTTMVTIVGVMLMLVAIGSAGYYSYNMRNRRGQDLRFPRVWHVPHVELILPEFLVEFEYIHGFEEIRKDALRVWMEFGPFACLLSKYAFFARMGDGPDNDSTPSHWPKALPELPAVPRLTNSVLLNPSLHITASNFASLHVLNLHGRCLRRIEANALDGLGSLRTLLLSFNCIESLGAIPPAYTGRVVVWRAPCQMPGDVEVWTAKELPSDHGAVPNNAVIVSAEGFANSGMAGGDFDGDLNMVCWDPDLIKIVKDTEAAVEALSPVGLEEDIVAMIRSAAEDDVAHNLIQKVNAVVGFPALIDLDLSWNQREP
eukprot:s2255_g2.t1